MPTAKKIRDCLETLAALRELDPSHPDYVAVERAAAHLAKSAKKKRRRRRRQERSDHDRSVLAQAERAAVYSGRAPGKESSAALIGTRRCYACKVRYELVDDYYHALCPSCSDNHREHRRGTVDVSGRRALVTGGRIKIGFESALRLLRGGASVTVTTRFPSDALARYRALDDFARFEPRLRIVGLDFRDVRGLASWIEAESNHEPLDILINNAAQTIRREPAYYGRLAQAELDATEKSERLTIPDASREALVRFHRACASKQDPAFPPGQLDIEGLQLDLSVRNSWTKTLAEIGVVELLETHLVTAVAPFLLCAGLKPAMQRSPFPDRYIINVSAMEGVFEFAQKTPRHPHTNMAKAALNMLTRTAAADYVESSIFMVSVDTGWITDENPEPKRALSAFCPPLDVVDGAARVLAPIRSGLAGEPVFGVFLKDYEVSPW